MLKFQNTKNIFLEKYAKCGQYILKFKIKYLMSLQQNKIKKNVQDVKKSKNHSSESYKLGIYIKYYLNLS